MEAGEQNSASDARKFRNRASTSKSSKSHQEDPNTSLNSLDIQHEEMIAVSLMMQNNIDIIMDKMIKFCKCLEAV